MKNIVVILLLIVFTDLTTYCQSGICDINTGCEETPFISIDPPIFDEETSSIVLGNATVGGFDCTAETYRSGIVVYAYQLLPNGERMEFCHVNNPAPFNVVGYVYIGFGSGMSFCGDNTIS